MSNTQLCTNVPDGTMKVNPYNCNSYLTCLGGLAFEQFCQDGLFFDQVKRQCDYPENVNCSPSGGGGGGGSGPIENPEMKPHPECAAAGPGTNLMLKHETDCNKFYKCDGNMAVTMKCPKDLHWNDAAKHCDFPENARCTV